PCPEGGGDLHHTAYQEEDGEGQHDGQRGELRAQGQHAQDDQGDAPGEEPAPVVSQAVQFRGEGARHVGLGQCGHGARLLGVRARAPFENRHPTSSTSGPRLTGARIQAVTTCRSWSSRWAVTSLEPTNSTLRNSKVCGVAPAVRITRSPEPT